MAVAPDQQGLVIFRGKHEGSIHVSLLLLQYMPHLDTFMYSDFTLCKDISPLRSVLGVLE